MPTRTFTPPTACPALDEHRRSARHHLDLPCDDGGELAHHLVARYLGAFADLAPDLAEDGGSPPLDHRALLAGLGEVFAAVADRHRLTADDPALRALARLLLDAGEAVAEPAGGRAGEPAARAGLTAAA